MLTDTYIAKSTARQALPNLHHPGIYLAHTRGTIQDLNWCDVGAESASSGPPSAGGAMAAVWLLASLGLVNAGRPQQRRCRNRCRRRRHLGRFNLPCNHGDGGLGTHNAPTMHPLHPQYPRCRLHSRCYLGRRLPSRPHRSSSMRRPANTGPLYTMSVSSVRRNGGEQLLARWG